MEEDQVSRLQTMLDQLDQQYTLLAYSMEENKRIKTNLSFYQYMKTFKGRTDSHYVGVAISKDLEEVERIAGYRLQPKQSYFGSFLIVALVLPNTLQLSLVENKFNLNLSLQFNKQRLCQTVALNETSPFIVVIPWKDFPINSELYISFFGKLNDTNIVFRIRKIVLSMPFFLRPAQDLCQNNKCGNYKENLVQMSKHYVVLKKCYFNEYNTEYRINIPKSLEIGDAISESFPHHLINISQSLIEDGTFRVLRDSSENSQVSLMKGKSFVEIHSDATNLFHMKQHYINEKYYNEAVEILAIKKFLLSTSKKANLNKTTELYHLLRELWKINYEEEC